MEKKKKGRPSNYKKEYNEQAKKLCRLGATDKELADFFGVSEQTVNSWKKSHPDFLESLKAGKTESDVRVVDALFSRANGYVAKETKVFCNNGEIITADIEKHYPPDTTAIIFWLKNRRPDLWRYNDNRDENVIKKLDSVLGKIDASME